MCLSELRLELFFAAPYDTNTIRGCGIAAKTMPIFRCIPRRDLPICLWTGAEFGYGKRSTYLPILRPRKEPAIPLPRYPMFLTMRYQGGFCDVAAVAAVSVGGTVGCPAGVVTDGAVAAVVVGETPDPATGALVAARAPGGSLVGAGSDLPRLVAGVSGAAVARTPGVNLGAGTTVAAVRG